MFMFMMSSMMRTFCDDITSFLEGLAIKVVLLTQRIDHVNLGVAEVNVCNGSVEYDIWEEMSGGSGGGTGPLHLVNWQAVIDLKMNRWRIIECFLVEIWTVYVARILYLLK